MISALLLSSGILLPPKQYDHPPKMPVVVIDDTPEEVERFCRKRAEYFGGRSIIGCAFPGKDICIIVMPNGYSRDLWRHERAHCNGFSHD